MNNCTNCGAALSLGAADCARCGTSIVGHVAPHEPVDTLDPTDNVLGNLWSGNYTLVKTYWLFGLVGGIAVTVLYLAVVGVTRSAFVAILGWLGVCVWQFFISVAIWRSAGKYTGSKVWAVLARVGVVIGIVRLMHATGEFF